MSFAHVLNRAGSITLVILMASCDARADVRLPAVFSDHMVLQRERQVPIWGWADSGEQVAVVFGEQTKTTTANDEGRWQVTLDPLSLGEAHSLGQARSLVVEGNNRLEFADVLVGDVWVCSGQSNMEWPVSSSADGDLELLGQGEPEIRFLTVSSAGTQEPLDDFDSAWERCTPGTIKNFSAVGYFFGKRLHQATGVPVGLIDNAWGGSACEAWVPVEKLAGNELYEPVLDRWKAEEAKADERAIREDYAKTHAEWKARMQQAIANNKAIPVWPKPRHRLLGQSRPGNLYNARVASLAPYAIRGTIWYQGESNAGRAEQYRDLFPLMVETWREAWGQGDFPFYWVQLADFMQEKDQPGDSAWAELREAQTKALDRLPNSGQAVIVDVGEGKDIHPKDKQSVGDRLARIALADDYGMNLANDSPRLESFEVKDGKVHVTLRDCRRGLTTFDTKQVVGFAIAGHDKQWVPATAEIVGKNQVVVSSDQIADPVAVRYAWADNPVCNLYSASGLPVTPFRTDEWPGVTAGQR